MAMIFESDEEETFEEMLDETDDDDDDYQPEGARSDSDPDFGGNRKRKSSRSSPSKSTRSSLRSFISSAKKSQSSTNKSTFSSRRSGATQSKRKVSPTKKAKTPAKKASTTKTTTPQTREKKREENSSLRRSSRGSRTISYADADLSEEENFEDKDLSGESDDEVYNREEEKTEKTKNSKKVGQKKKHADDLWESFKADVDKTNNKGEEENIGMASEKSAAKVETQVKEPSITVTEKLKSEKLDNDVNTENGTLLPDTKDKINSTHTDTRNDKKVDESKTSSISPIKLDKCPEDINKGIEVNKDDRKDLLNKQIDKTKSTIESDEKSSLEMTHTAGSNKEAKLSTLKTGDEIKIPASTSTVANKDNLSIAINNIAKECNQERKEDRNKITITEAFDFAGEKIIKTKVIDANSAEGRVHLEKEERKNSQQDAATKPGTSSGVAGLLSSGVKRPSGLSGVLGDLEKKKKMSVLDKSKHDWDNYKDEMGIENELKGNRNAGYLDRQEFLQRVDYKQWENEREMRLYSNHK